MYFVHRCALPALIFTMALGGCDDGEDGVEPIPDAAPSGGSGGEADAGGVGGTGGGEAGSGGGQGGAGGAPDLSDALREALEARGQSAWESADLPGFSIAVVQGSEVVWSRGWGFADIEGQVPATPETPYTLGSISKAIMAVGVMQAVDAGHLTLNTPLSELPMPFAITNPRAPEGQITLEHLVTHTSGIRDGDAYDCAYAIDDDGSALYHLADPDLGCPEPVQMDQALFVESHLTPEGALYDEGHWAAHAPGARYSYTNVGSALTAVAFQAATGQGLDMWTSSKIFDPLGMTSTYWHAEGATMPMAVRYYRPEDDGPLEPLPAYSLSTWADGGLKSSAQDLGAFLGAVVSAYEGTETVLTPTAAQAMLASRLDIPSESDWQGVFWSGAGGVFGHSGSDPGADTLMFYDRTSAVGVVLLTNADDDFADLTPVHSLFFDVFEIMGSDFEL
ncbi:MAG: serine hydrolase domain-containing protein [Bradymonadia bacterium]